MITSFTEVIFIDEASESTLDIGDWKVLTQGGYSAHDVKYQTAKAILNKCPMIITAQHKLQFGPTHQPAMEKRLRTYVFKALPNPKKNAAAWLKKHAMDCVVWATEKAKDCQGDSEAGENDEDDNAVKMKKESCRTRKKKNSDVLRWPVPLPGRPLLVQSRMFHKTVKVFPCPKTSWMH